MDDVTNPDVHDHGFVPAPVNRVVGVIDDPEVVPGILASLHKAGFADDKIHVFVGEEGERNLDLAGTHHGWRARITRGLQQLGFESDVFHEADAELKAGHALIGVLTDGSAEQRSQVARVLRAHHVHSLHFFGSLEVEDL
jgi:hypothetical protein